MHPATPSPTCRVHGQALARHGVAPLAGRRGNHGGAIDLRDVFGARADNAPDEGSPRGRPPPSDALPTHGSP